MSCRTRKMVGFVFSVSLVWYPGDGVVGREARKMVGLSSRFLWCAVLGMELWEGEGALVSVSLLMLLD